MIYDVTIEEEEVEEEVMNEEYVLDNDTTTQSVIYMIKLKMEIWVVKRMMMRMMAKMLLLIISISPFKLWILDIMHILFNMPIF